MTLGAKLLESEEKRNAVIRQAKGRALVDFFKITCAAEVNQAIENGRSTSYILPPQEIRHLFARPLSHGDRPDHENPNSEFVVEWMEIKAWAAEQQLRIVTGYTKDSLQYSTPWGKLNWMGKVDPIRPDQNKDAEVIPEKSFWESLADAVFGRR